MKGEADGRRKSGFLNLTSAKNSRRETAYQAYYRIYKPDLQIKVLDAYHSDREVRRLANEKSLCYVGFRNAWLKKKLQEEPDEVRELIENSRMNAGDGGAGRRIASLVDITNAESEEERVKCARLLQK